MMEATLNGKILVDHKINLNEPIGGDRILLDIISRYDDLNESSWYIDTTLAEQEGVVSLQKVYGDKLWVKVGDLKSSTFFFLGNVNGDLLRIDILPQIRK